MPYFPPETESEAFFKNYSQEEKLVSDYTRLNFVELEELTLYEYWGYVHDAIVHNNNQSSEGREYLKNAYIYRQDKADRTGLKELLHDTSVVR